MNRISLLLLFALGLLPPRYVDMDGYKGRQPEKKILMKVCNNFEIKPPPLPHDQKLYSTAIKKS